MSEEKNIPDESREPQAESDKPAQEVRIQNSESEKKKEEPAKDQPATSNQQPAFAEASDKPATQNMEVHKHPHHVMHKKKWTEYFLEFLMIFLAVTLGFFAEQIRESFVESRREKEYIVSMLEDLRKDSTFLTLSINKLIPYHLSWLDSTVHLFKMPDFKSKDRLIYQAFMVGTAWTYNFRPTERTLSQLHSEGFHLIRNKNAATSISQLEDQYKQFNLQITTFVENMQNDIDLSAWSFADRVVADKINTTAFQHFSDSSSVQLQLSDIPESATINVQDKEGIRSYIEKLRKYSFYLQYGIKGGQVVLLREISKTIDLLEKEYNQRARS